jgi:molybdenum cofactor biosynthesis enzyme MoaA
MAVVNRTLEMCPSIRSVCVAGFGEPLLASNLAEIVTNCKARGLMVGIITNGVLLADYAKIFKSWNVDSVSISLNAATAKRHEACNGTKTWDRVIAGIEEAVKLMPGRVAVSMVCHGGNYAEMPDFLTLAAKLGVPTVDFLTLLPTQRETAEEYWSKMEGDVPVQELTGHPERKRIRTWPVMKSPDSPCPRACKSPYDSISVDAEGFYSPCRRVMPPGKNFGSIMAAWPPWRAPAWYSLRATIEGDKPMLDVCKLCFGNWSG